MKQAEEDLIKRASKLWKSKIRSIDDLDELLMEVEELSSVFEGCQTDLEDLQLMRQALRLFQKDYQQIEDIRLTWSEFDDLTQTLVSEAEDKFGDEEMPWDPVETITVFVNLVSKKRKAASEKWIKEFEAEAASITTMSAADTNRLYGRANTPPAVVTESHSKRLAKVVRDLEARLEELKIDWLLEKYNELSPSMRKKFLEVIAAKSTKR